MRQWWHIEYEQQITGEWESIRRTVDSNPVVREYREWSEVFCLEGYKMTQEQKDAMYEEVYKPIADWEEQIQKSNKELMKQVKAKVSGSLYWGICRYMKDLVGDCYHTGQMEYK